MMWGGDWVGGWGIGFALMHLLWWILIIAAGAFFLRWAMRESGARPPNPDARGAGESAEAILRQRFARGEIDQREYEERLRVLRG